ncbi:hypothetical protein CAOG_04419 [Capsaspora owczarzaki ATCC 30864]|uniref:Uncharacterized protein n=1 Tax=Capsaspora owczarzaki (strain ATCC 30864) TaxID=595528 RepID=A0A0D2WQ31_CAPO3|nr:hypothetical protein CAOG_04419 [Capsaspora owczarzaki ATCC 30864]KJE93665.1 hypothetical protein CAOG_004419 [Capsaspora owczarzaki ATCC 30864]|eukprot:XP_004348247.1 hypothetical protein CAOG_04419 [Capsaspora owczarzaki ATCC 30864]
MGRLHWSLAMMVLLTVAGLTIAAAAAETQNQALANSNNKQQQQQSSVNERRGTRNLLLDTELAAQGNVSDTNNPYRCKCTCPNNTTIAEVATEADCDCDQLLHRADCMACSCVYQARNDGMIQAMVYIFMTILCILCLLVALTPVAKWYMMGRNSRYFSSRGIPQTHHLDTFWETLLSKPNK